MVFGFLKNMLGFGEEEFLRSEELKKMSQAEIDILIEKKRIDLIIKYQL